VISDLNAGRKWKCLDATDIVDVSLIVVVHVAVVEVDVHRVVLVAGVRVGSSRPEVRCGSTANVSD
jgi:hypothetical protein